MTTTASSTKTSKISASTSLVAVITALVSLVLVAVNPASVRADTAQQAKWVGDVPIMPSLTVEKGLGFAFDSPEGRIVMIYLSGDTSPEEVMAYYDSALIPLGWAARSPRKWSREGESLAITRTSASSIELWKLMITPE